jgi:hypothetical protein
VAAPVGAMALAASFSWPSQAHIAVQDCARRLDFSEP